MFVLPTSARLCTGWQKSYIRLGGCLCFKLLCSFVQCISSPVHWTTVSKSSVMCSAVQEVLLFPAMKPDVQKKKDEAEVKKSDENSVAT